MWPYSWTHVGTPSHLGHMDPVAATMPSQAHAGAAQEAPNIGQWEGQDVPLVRPSSCIVKGGIPSSRRYLPTYLSAIAVVHVELVGRLQRKGLYLGVLHEEVSPQYEVEGLSVHHIEPMGDSSGAHWYLHFTVSAAVHHMSIPHLYSRGGHGVIQAPTR